MPERNTRQIRSLGQQYDACPEAIAWAERECVDAADIWRKADPEKLLWIATRDGILSDAHLHQFAKWALVHTPPKSESDRERIAKCLDGSDRLTYPNDMSRERWAVLALIGRGQMPGFTRDQVRDVQAKYLRSLVTQPFTTEVR